MLTQEERERVSMGEKGVPPTPVLALFWFVGEGLVVTNGAMEGGSLRLWAQAVSLWDTGDPVMLGVETRALPSFCREFPPAPPVLVS